MTVVINGTTGVTAPGTQTFGSGTALGGATNPIVSMAQGANNYVQSYIINNTNGTSASADFVAYPDNGADSHGWVDMGITSSAYADTTYTVTGPNESYLFASAPSGSGKTGNLVIATDNTGTANSIQFYTNGFTQAKSAAKMVIDGATGNVGIGTSSPSQKLTIATAATVDIAMQLTNGLGSLKISDFSDGSTAFENTAAYPMRYIINGTERARIDSSGNLLVNTTSVNLGKLNVVGANGVSPGLFQVFANGDYAIAFRNASGTTVGGIAANSASTTYVTSSDYRLKENIAPMTGALSVVSQLKPCTYKWKADGSDGQGFIAHELQAIVPDCVTGEKDAVDADGNPVYQGIDTSFLVATLTAAIQEQQAIIQQLQADVESLKNR